jgi:anti-sigma B factor antagonist
MDLQLSTRSLDGRALVTVGGEVDLDSAAQLHDHAVEAVRDVSPHLVLDLSGVSFMDSTGLKVLVSLQRRTDLAQGSLVLVGTARPVRRILALTGLDQTFALYDMLDQVPEPPAVTGGAAPRT